MDTLLSTDFGSESEDDNFNPAPAVGSDDDGAGESDVEETSKPRRNGTISTRQSPPRENYSDERVGEQGSAADGKSSNTGNVEGNQDEDEDDNDGEKGDAPAGALRMDGARDDDDEEDEDDDEDDDDAVFVSLTMHFNIAHV